MGGLVKTKIQAELKRVSDTEDLRVLYAVESGSRAWGFASTDSGLGRAFHLPTPP